MEDIMRITDRLLTALVNASSENAKSICACYLEEAWGLGYRVGQLVR